MNKKYFTDSLSDEVLAGIIDDTLKFKKNAKDKNIKTHILKIVPIVAALLLVIGLANLTPFINLRGDNSGFYPGARAILAQNYEQVSQNELTVIPRLIEKSVFESLIERIPNGAGTISGRVLAKMQAYYTYKDISHPDLTEISRAELAVMFPFAERGAFYIFDPHASWREIWEILGYWNEYIGWSDEEYLAMLDDYYRLSDDSLTILPRLIEKSVFESLMADIPADIEITWNDKSITGEHAVQVFNAYYALKAPFAFDPELGYIYPHLYRPGCVDAFYMFDLHANDREFEAVLGLWNQCTNWTDAEYFKMLDAYELIMPGNDPQPASYIIDDLSMLEFRQAMINLEQPHILTDIIYQESAYVPAGYIIRTEPGPGVILDPGDTIIIYVSLGYGEINEAGEYINLD
jgi:hypothetical protein